MTPASIGHRDEKDAQAAPPMQGSIWDELGQIRGQRPDLFGVNGLRQALSP